MIKYLKRFWSECFDGDAPTPYAQLQVYMATLFLGVFCFFVAVLAIFVGYLFSMQIDPILFGLLLIGIGNTVFGTLLLKGLRSKYSDLDFEPNKT